MFFWQHGKDQKLSHNLTSKITLTMGTKHPADYIWVPDILFVDATMSYMHKCTDNQSQDRHLSRRAGGLGNKVGDCVKFIRSLSKRRSK